MATLTLIPSSPAPAQGQPLSVVLHADFDSGVLGAARLRLRIPGTGFDNIEVVPLAFPDPNDVFVVSPATSALGITEVDCARAAGAAGLVDLLRIDCTVIGYRAVSYSISAEVIDAVDVEGQPLGLSSAELSIPVEPGLPEVVTTALRPGFATVAYREVLWAQGGKPPYAWAIASGALPAGIVLDASGEFSGTASSPVSATFTIRVTDQGGQSAAAQLSLVIRYAPLAITVSELPPAAPGRRYSQLLTATGGKPPIHWEVDGLPQGMSVTNFTLRGTPDENRDLFGLVPLVLRATDADTPPQQASRAIGLPFLPALPQQNLHVPSPGAVVVAPDLCLIEYVVTSSGRVRRLEGPTGVEAEMDRARNELIAAIAEVVAEMGAPKPPLERAQYKETLVGLIDLYRDLDARKRNGESTALELRVLVDDQVISTQHSGGQRTIHELRGRAGRPLLPWAEPRSAAGKKVRAAFAQGGKRLRSWARDILDAAFDDYASGRPRARRSSRRRSYGGIGAGPGADLIPDLLEGLLPSLEGMLDFGRWFDDLIPTPGEIRLTPGRHRVRIHWDGLRVADGAIIGVGGIVSTTLTRSDIVSFSVTFRPKNPLPGPRFASSTVLSGSELGMPGSRSFDVSLCSTGLDIVAASSLGLRLSIDSGEPSRPYEQPTNYGLDPGFTPQRISAAVLDPYGRSSLLLHSANRAALVLNRGPAGLHVVQCPLTLNAGERVLSMAPGAVEASGWRPVHVSTGRRLATFKGLAAISDAAVLPQPDIVPLTSSVVFDHAASLALLEPADGSSQLAVGFDADGRVTLLDQAAALVPPGRYQQPVHLLAGNFSGGDNELAVALRQAKQVRVFRWHSGSWEPLAPIELPVRPWELAQGPAAVPCLAVASRRFGSVLLVVWADPDQPPKLIELRAAAPGVRIGGHAGTLAVADPAADRIVVFR